MKAADVRSVFWVLCLTSLVTVSAFAEEPESDEEKSFLMKVVTKGGKIVRTEIVPDATPTAETPIESIPVPAEIEFQAASPRPKSTPPPHALPSTSRSAMPSPQPSMHPSVDPAKLPSPSPSPKPAGPDAELLRLLRR